MTSNSTLTQLSFDSNSSQFSFTVSGPSETFGYVNLYVPKTLLADPSKMKVYLDNTPLDYTVQPDGDSWLVLFNYTHSTHNVIVDLTGAATIAETKGEQSGPDLLIYALPITAVVIALIIVVAVKTRRKKQPP